MSSFRRLLPRIARYKYKLVLIALFSTFASLLSIFSLIALKPVLEIMFADPAAAIEAVAAEPIAGEITAEAAAESLLEKFKFLQDMVGDYLVGGQQRVIDYMMANRLQALYAIALLMLVAAAFNGLLTYATTQLTSIVGLDLEKRLRNDLFGHITTRDLGYFSTISTGELMARVTNDIRKLRLALLSITGSTVQDAFRVVAVTALLIWLSPRLTLYAALTLPPLGIVFYWTGKKVRRLAAREEHYEAGIFSVMQEVFSGLRVVKAFGAEEFENERFGRATQEVYRHTRKVEKVKSLVSPTTEFLSVAAVVLTLVAGGKLFLLNSSPLGEDFNSASFFVYLIAITRFYRPIKNLSKLNVTLKRGAASLDRIYEIFDVELVVTESPDPKPMSSEAPEVAFDGVSFAYPGRSDRGSDGGADRGADKADVLHDLTLTAAPGEVIALVGKSGAGKTTLINLLCRFYDPRRGAIRIGGCDLREISFASLRERIAIVPQETFLFDDTVHNNVAYGRPGVAREEVERAARLAHAHEFIVDMPRGYDTLTGERGDSLSTGQKQRLAIARAILRNPSVLIFDEATSSLDSETERLIRDGLKNLAAGRTTFIIAHRFATVMLADRIIVLHHGRIVEQGTHAELYEADGRYTALCKDQGILFDTPTEVAG